MLIIKNKRPDFKLLFQEYLELVDSTSFDSFDNTNLLYDNYDYFDYDDYPSYSDYYNKWHNKGRKNKGKKNKHKVASLLNYEDDFKIIYFYEDVDNPDENVHVFHDIFEFDDFLQSKGISTQSDTDSLMLLNNEVIHCCIDPTSRDNGDLKLLCDTSFGSLRWEYASKNDEVSQ